MKLLVTIPTYNECENIRTFIKALFENIPNNADVLVIDDNSPDGTASQVKEMIKEKNGRLNLIVREGKQGLATAYLAGFAWGIECGNYDLFLQMDADFSHNPQYIQTMLKKIETNDIVIGSRNVLGGRVEGWSAARNCLSKGGSLYSRIVLNCPIKDLTGGFNMWRKTALQAINLAQVISKGYSFQIEMKYKAYRAGCRIYEIPIIFPDRKLGKSKMSKKIIAEALLNIWKIRFESSPAFFELLKFFITGVLGTVTNLLIFFIAADLYSLPVIPVNIVCFLITVTQNYFINHLWSFQRQTRGVKPSLKLWLKFISASFLGLAVNITVLQIILISFNPPYKVIAQACGIIAGTGVNFLCSKFVVFSRIKN